MERARAERWKGTMSCSTISLRALIFLKKLWELPLRDRDRSIRDRERRPRLLGGVAFAAVARAGSRLDCRYGDGPIKPDLAVAVTARRPGNGHLLAAALAASVACGLLASACGGGSGPAGGAADASDAATDGDAAAERTCMLGASPVATSTSCGAHPELCGVACGDTCVDLAKDADNCGRCGIRCPARAACNQGVCGVEPTTLVPSAPGCRSLRLAYEGGAITWSDLGHGTINRISTDGGAP